MINTVHLTNICPHIVFLEMAGENPMYSGCCFYLIDQRLFLLVLREANAMPGIELGPPEFNTCTSYLPAIFPLPENLKVFNVTFECETRIHINNSFHGFAHYIHICDFLNNGIYTFDIPDPFCPFLTTKLWKLHLFLVAMSFFLLVFRFNKQSSVFDV